MKRPVLASATVAAALTLAGCAAFSDDGSEGTQVAAAFYPLAYVSERVAGDLATVHDLTNLGTEPHDLELNIEQTARIAQADLVVYELDFQPAVDDAVEQNAVGEVLDAADVVHLQPFGGEDDDDHDQDDEDHDGHDHDGDLDPHFWLDPTNLAAVGDRVADELGEVDPEHAEEYAANAADLRADLTELDEAFTAGLADCERSTIVASHDAYGYLDRYGIEVAPVAGLSPDAEPTPATLGRLQELIREDGITTVFNEPLASTRFTDGLARDTGLDTAVLDPIEGLSDQTSDQDYLTLMRANLAALREANGCR